MFTIYTQKKCSEPAGNYIFKVNNRHTSTANMDTHRYSICLLREIKKKLSVDHLPAYFLLMFVNVEPVPLDRDLTEKPNQSRALTKFFGEMTF